MRAQMLQDDGVFDDLAVELTAEGRTDLRVTRVELDAAIRKLEHRGVSIDKSVELLGVSDDLIQGVREAA